MEVEQQSKLREPFPAASIGKLPKGGTQLDYVGHAAVTDRLLQVDPDWNWEPVAFDAEGAPLIQLKGKQLVMWIRLTVGGVTRLGVGTVAPEAFDAPKQLIGDALRNGAMRFGVALDLWSKEELVQPAPEPEATVDLTGKIAALTQPERKRLADEWKKKLSFKAGEVPVSQQATAEMLIDSVVGTGEQEGEAVAVAAEGGTPEPATPLLMNQPKAKAKLYEYLYEHLADSAVATTVKDAVWKDGDFGSFTEIGEETWAKITKVADAHISAYMLESA